ncbi:DUF2855 family protein [Altererythrobacter sp. MF3-039]|uniref:DUF2855 family protein n=1 Tax=Altererythrobacter sp. MF3-039 TaxID=3252901 RepID=UPI00390CC6F8
MPKQVHVRKDQLDNAQTVEVPAPTIGDGQVLLEVESFSVTSNNITYAVVGEQIGYWKFFPPFGENVVGKLIVPMWGHAKVVESKSGEVAVGERVYGYLPMATHLVVEPGNISASGFVDMTDYRQPLPPIYNQYSRLAADPEHDPSREAERMIFGPLFKTGFLLDYFMAANDWFGAERVIMTSASSKTAIGMASVAKQNSSDITRVGLTSSGNVDFVKGTGLYDEVLPYDDVGSLSQAPSVSVDFAGNGSLLASIHQTLGDNLKYSCLVGVTHIDERRGPAGQADGLPGPQPTMFFAPDHAIAIFKELGPQVAGKRMAAAWAGFLEAADGTVSIERKQGLDAARETYVEMVGGSVDPSQGIVVEP